MLGKNLMIQTFRSTLPIRNFRPCKYGYSDKYVRAIVHRKSHSTITATLTEKLNSVTKQFDSVLGIAEVRTAQSLVQAAEEKFMKSRRLVQETRTELLRLQNQLRELRSKLDRIPREDERYLQLATEEHKVLIAEKKAKANLETLETLERDQFSALSGAVRSAHEKERSRAERTKYWSIIGSACGAVLGILGSTIINMKRMKQIRVTVEENNNAFISKTIEELRPLFQHGQQGMSSSEIPTNQTTNDFLELLHENNKRLRAIDEKLEKFSDEENFASKVQEPVVSRHDSQKSNVGIDRRLEQLTWWSKASFIATMSGSACLIIYTLMK